MQPMKFEEVITLQVQNWPRFRRQTSFVLDVRLMPDERSIREYAHRRFGDGLLRKTGESQWTYERRISGPAWFWGMLGSVLNKSYV